MQSIPSALNSVHREILLNRFSKPAAQKVSSSVVSAHDTLADTFTSLHFGADEEKPTPGSGAEPLAKIPEPDPTDPKLTASTPPGENHEGKPTFEVSLDSHLIGQLIGQKEALEAFLKQAKEMTGKPSDKNKAPIIVFTSPSTMGKSAYYAQLKKDAELKKELEKNPPPAEGDLVLGEMNDGLKNPPKKSANPIIILDDFDEHHKTGSLVALTSLMEFFDSKPLPPGSFTHENILAKAKIHYIFSDAFPHLDTSTPLPEKIEALRTGLLKGKDVSAEFIQAVPDLLLNQPLNVIHRLSKAVEAFFDVNYHSQKSHANEAELLLLLNHPDLWDRDPKKTRHLTEALTSITRFMHQPSVPLTDTALKAWASIGTLTHSFRFWKWDAKGGENSLLTKFGFRSLPTGRPGDAFGKGFVYQDEKTGCTIEFRRGYLLATHPEYGTLVVRNSSPAFGRDLMEHPAYLLPNALTLDEIKAFNPEHLPKKFHILNRELYRKPSQPKITQRMIPIEMPAYDFTKIPGLTAKSSELPTPEPPSTPKEPSSGKIKIPLGMGPPGIGKSAVAKLFSLPPALKDAKWISLEEAPSADEVALTQHHRNADERLLFLTEAIESVKEDYRRFKLDTLAFENYGENRHFTGHLSEGLPEIVAMFNQLHQEDPTKPLPSLAFVHPHYPIYQPNGVYPMTPEHLKELNAFVKGELHGDALVQSDWLKFMVQDGVSQQGELVILDPEAAPFSSYPTP
jgi:hypothetical protein